MSKKVSFPVMSLAFTGILFIVGLLVITLRPFALTALSTGPTSTYEMINGLLLFIATFLLLWALTSLSLHPDIEDSNIKLIFAAFTVFIIIAVFSTTFSFAFTLWPGMH
jgi:hypothetical protein